MTEAFDKQAVLATIKQQIADNPVILYMKGSPQMAQCGFSAKAVKILQACNQPFAFVDILQHPEIRATLPKYADWPTFPQLYLQGELIGGSDIIDKMYDEGELQQKLAQLANELNND